MSTRPPGAPETTRKGEVHELRALLRNPKMVSDAAKFKTVVEKVIAYMTLGIDVSPLFTDMIMATNTKDLVQKKMVYLYLCTYAEQNSELALLTINTLQKDCRDDDPMVRGLALRSLCSLRVPKLVEYILLPIRTGLADTSPYVRKTAVIGCAKLFSMDPAVVKSSDIVDQLYTKLKDRDNEVIINSIYALNEILADEKGMSVNKKIIIYLLNKLHEFHEWGQCAVLELVNKYHPEDPQEVFDFMNALEDRLKHSNSAVVLATTKVFLNFTREMPKVHVDVYKRLKSPLITMMASATVESSFAVLSHVSMLIRRCRGVFDDEYKRFYIRYNDPLCVKSLKIDVLGELANEESVSDILSELSEYVTNIDIEIARQAIKIIGKIAVKVERAASEAIEHLLSFLDLSMDYVSNQTCIAMKDILRKYPDRQEEILPGLKTTLKTVEEPEGKVAALWMIGEYGEWIDDAPYILEPIIENFHQETSSAVKLEILTTAMKLFFRRPPEVHKMLGQLLASVIADCTEVDVRERALLYYRLLKLDVYEAAKIVNAPRSVIDVFLDMEDVELNDRLFEEFNTLSVVYGKPSEQFINLPTPEDEEDEEDDRASEAKINEESKLLSKEYDEAYERESERGETGSVTEYTAPVAPGLSSFSPVSPPPSAGSGSGPIYSASATVPPAAALSPPGSSGRPGSAGSIALDPSPVCSPDDFQNFWGTWKIAAVITIRLPPSSPADLAGRIESSMNARNFVVIASGTVGSQVKLYMFAQKEGHAELILVEIVADLSTGTLSATFKGENERITKLVADGAKGALASL